MGDDVLSEETFRSASKKFVASSGPATARAEQKAHATGKLNPLVDPAGYGVIRRSLCRLNKQANGLWLLTVGTPMPIETRVDTTGSMGGNVDVVLRVLPKAHELWSIVLPGYDLQIATGIFGDICDRFVLCRPQFEMTAEKIVEQLTLMVPERSGGDAPEDPHYGLFGAAYLTDRYINRIGLKGYDFTVSDSPAHNLLDERELKRIYGDEVLEKVAECLGGPYAQGLALKSRSRSVAELVQDVLAFTHAFFLQVDDRPETTRFWTEAFGKDRVVVLPSTELLPQVQATIIGLTEGTLNLQEVKDFLTKNNVSESDAKRIVRSVAGIPIGAQASLPNFGKRPQKGDLFKEKTDVWPIDRKEVVPEAGDEKPAGPTWL